MRRSIALTVALLLGLLVMPGWATHARAQPPATAMSPGTWSLTGSLHVGRSQHTATLLPDGKVLVAGGFTGDSTTPIATAELYDPHSRKWTKTGSMMTPRAYHTATALPSGQVLVTGGYADSNRASLATAELYTPSTGRWTATGTMALGRWNHSATALLSGKVLVVGGIDLVSSQAHNRTAEVYDPASGSWASTGSMRDGRESPELVLLHSGQVLVAGGCCVDQPQYAALTSVELYDPATGRWTPTGSLTEPRINGTVTVLASGQVLAVGGGEPTYAADLTTELWDPATGVWHRAADTNDFRYLHTATVMPSGDILLAGGEITVGGMIREEPEAEIYHPSSGSFSRVPDLQVGVGDHTATLLASGAVLVAGGNQYPVNAVQAELFTAVPDTIQRKYAALAVAGLQLGSPTTAEHPITGGREQSFQAGQIDSSPASGTHEVHGAIRELYLQRGGSGGGPADTGLPLTDETPARDGIGRFNDFTLATIYWSPWTGAHLVYGPTRELWTALGQETGFLGYPTSEAGTFTGGNIYSTDRYSPDGAHTNEVHGSILVEYLALHANLGLLRTPVTNESVTPDGIGRYNHFVGGSIYWSPGSGAHEVHGVIAQHWAALGWERSAVGYPTSDEQAMPDGYGRFNTFIGGAIYNRIGSGTHEVHGSIYQRWMALGGASIGSALGYPVSDEYAVPGGRRSDFSVGWMIWDAGTGRITICQVGLPNIVGPVCHT